MDKRIATAIQIAGVISLTIGASILHPAAGFITAGILLLLAGIASAVGDN